MMLNLISGSGYYIGLGIEAAVALVAGVLLVLLLANVFVKNEEEVSQTEATTSLVAVEAQPDSWVVTEQPVGEVVTEEVRKPDTVVVNTPTGETVVTEERTDATNPQPVIINIYTGSPDQSGSAEAKPEETPAEETKPEDEGVKFAEVSKTITELYEELDDEQKRFFDELKAKAMSKPQAALSVTKNYESVKVGKHSILKLLIRKGVTVAEFLLESDALKEYRKSSPNRKGKSKIRIRPTVIAVTDVDSLKTALDMIDIAHEQLFDD